MSTPPARDTPMMLVSPTGARVICTLENLPKLKRNRDGSFKAAHDGAIENDWQERKALVDSGDDSKMPRMFVDENCEAYLESALQLVPAKKGHRT